MNYFCCNDTRRNAVLLHSALNGIDYVEVLDKLSDPHRERQTTFFVHFLKPVNPGAINAANLLIEGGERIKHITVIDAHPERQVLFPTSQPGENGKVWVVKVSEAGDFSTYTLRLVQDKNNTPPEGFDPVLSAVDFSFKVACPGDFDCATDNCCAPEPVAAPEINYLTKDYAGFRQLMLDRMALLLPGWRERNPADIGITLMELLAYVGDYLSYRQDAIATEAYLSTARKRVSVRRHARLVDYFMHEGCNARTWLHIQVGEGVDGLLLKKEVGTATTKVLTKVDGLPDAFRIDSSAFEKAVSGGVKVFELMQDVTLYTAHNSMKFYTWGSNECCLPKGATQATLSGSYPNLKAGDILIFAEVLGSETGVPQDANPAHRHAVRLTRVVQSSDPLYGEVTGISVPGSPLNRSSLPVTEISWHQTDALPFPLCISGHNGIENISIAWGNNVLVDHGLTIQDRNNSSLQPARVPRTNMVYAKSEGSNCATCEQMVPTSVAPRYRPQLLYGPLTYAAPFDITSELSATTVMKWAVRAAKPVIILHEENINTNLTWKPERDLLNSAFNAKEFVVEPESDGLSYIRFGDNKQGAQPAQETKFFATYRIGNGVSGNIGPGSLAHIVTNDATVIAHMNENAAVWNPFSAQGGMEAESIEEVKQYAPAAFRTQQRAVTSADYEQFATRCNPDVQEAAATFRWTGSWKTVFLSIDRLEGREVDKNFEQELRNCLEKYRMAGFDLEIDAPLYVSLEITMIVCVKPGYFASDVRRALLDLFGTRILPDGRRGVFHPDNFSFGQPVYLSPLYAAAQASQGVDSVHITKFQRQGKDSTEALAAGKLLLGRREIARLSNDRNFPERGKFNLIMKGGRI